MSSKHLRQVHIASGRQPCLALPLRQTTGRRLRPTAVCADQEVVLDARSARDVSSAAGPQPKLRTVLDFLNLAVHDLTQPVQALELALAQIERKSASAGTAAELVTARGSVERMRELLRMLLEICRIESGTVRVDEQPVRISEMFGYLERQFGPVARAKGLAFTCGRADQVIETDATFLRSLLANLVSNAIRYTRSGEVRLRVQRRAQGSLRLEVSDTGIGVARGELERIFEDFRRLDPARRVAAEGFGLGLGIVRRVSRMLGLPVTVRSRLGRGSTFCVEIAAGKVLAVC